MAYTETTSTSYGQRLAGSAKGMIGGLLMFIIGTCLLWWNEGRTVRTAKAIGDAASHVESVADVSRVDASLNGKLIHASAFADTKDTLTDDMFGVRELAIRLDRKVEYYQWVENAQTKEREKIGGGKETTTTYTYEKKWVDKPVNSAEFKDPQYQSANKVLSEVEERNEMAQHVTFGAYTLPESFVASISGSEPVEVRMTEEQRFTWNERLHMLRPKVNTETSLVHTSANTAYLGLSPNSPQVGDVRVTFTKVPPADISLIAQVDGFDIQGLQGQERAELLTGADGYGERGRDDRAGSVREQHVDLGAASGGCTAHRDRPEGHVRIAADAVQGAAVLG